MEVLLPKVILHDKYYLKEKLGVGYTAKVYLAIEIETQHQYAIKILKQECKSSELPKEFIQEIEMLKRINHINVIRLIDADIGYVKKSMKCAKKRCYLVFEYAENNNLYEYIYRTQKGFGEYFGRYIFTEIVHGLEACHNAGVVHRDLKAENILVDSEWRAKLSDFGYARLLIGDLGNKCLRTIVGTKQYAPPEMIKQQLYTGVPLDIFSLGVCLFIIVNGKMPFRSAEANDPFYSLIINNEVDNYWRLLTSKGQINISKELIDLISRMLAFIPKERISIKDIYSHPWMQMKLPQYEEVQLEYRNRANYIYTNIRLQTSKYHATASNGIQVYRSEQSAYAHCNTEEYTDSHNPYKLLLPDINPFNLMDDLVKFYEKKETVTVEISKIKVKFTASVEDNRDDDDDDNEGLFDEPQSFSIEIKHKRDSTDYYLEMMKRSGPIDSFISSFHELIQELKK